MKKIFYYLIVTVTLLGAFYSCKKGDTSKPTDTGINSEYTEYIKQVEEKSNSLSPNREKQRNKWIAQLKANPIYISLVDSAVVSIEYLPLLTAVSDAIKNTALQNGETIFSIDEKLAKEIENSRDGEAKMKFIIPVSCLAMKMNGGLPEEIVAVFERYRKRYDLYGSEGDLRVDIGGNQEKVTSGYNISYAFALFDPQEHKALDAIYESVQNGLGSWNTDGGDYENLYMATREGYMEHLKKYYKESPYLIKADFELSPEELYAAYDANEVSADEKFKGKTIAITGRISDIKKDILDHPYVSFDTDYLKSVTCYFSDDASREIAHLRKGETITIIGKCRGLTLTNVVIKDCKIAP